jgi:outer membrane lipoprotein-sorting protein
MLISAPDFWIKMKSQKTMQASLFLALCFSSMLPAMTFLEQVRAKIISSQPFKADFVQQVFIDGELNLEESGFIVFADRTLVKWQYLRPDYKTFILENGRYRFYDRENNQLLNGRIDPGNEQLVWDMLFSQKPGQFSRWEERTRTILLSVNEGSGRQELKIKVGSDFLPERVEQTSANEVTTVYLFKKYLTHITLEADEFALNIPANVEIIEEE